MHIVIFNRRNFLSSMAIGAAAFYTRGAFADELTRTPAQTEGPFYPDHLPLDTDNDLIIVNDSLTPAVGEVTHLSGKVLDASGSPVRNALVEIWQVDGNGVYLHSGSGHGEKRDKNFQGFGRFLTGSTGEYYFRTVKPVPYPGRTAHIHFKIKRENKELLTTQCYVKGAPGQLATATACCATSATKKRKASVIVDFAKVPDSRIGESGRQIRRRCWGWTPEAK